MTDMDDVLAKLAEQIGGLCGAARYDWLSADPSEVGLDGVPVKGWRDGYFEGCKDMADKALSCVPEVHHEKFREIAKTAFSKAYDDAADKAASR